MSRSGNQESVSLISGILETYGDSPEVLSEIFAIFLDEAPARLDALKTATEAGDFDAVKAVAHSLANTTGTLKVQSALLLARETEAAARSGDRATVPRCVALLDTEVTAIIAAIRDYLSLPMD